MAPVFYGNFEDLYSEADQYKPEGSGTFTHAEDRAQAARIHKQVSHTHTPAPHTHTPAAQIHISAAHTHTPALHPAGITGNSAFYCRVLYRHSLV